MNEKELEEIRSLQARLELRKKQEGLGTTQNLLKGQSTANEDWSFNPFDGLSFKYIESRTFLEKCIDTFFVFSGTPTKKGILTTLWDIPFWLALFPFKLFLAPLFFLFEELNEKQARNPHAESEYSSLTWFLAIVWSIPGWIGASVLGIAAVIIFIALVIAAIAVVIAAVIAAAVTALPALPFIWMINNVKQNHKNYAWYAWIVPSILAIPTILIALGVVIGLAVAAFSGLIALAVASLALTIASIPIIGVVHALLGPPEARTPVRRSFWLNPLTYVMTALLAVGISLLIQGVNPSVFFDAAAPLMITQTVLMSLAALALVAGLLYVMYRAGLAIVSSINDKKFQHVDIETTKGAQAEVNPNYITKYLGEHLDWIQAKWGQATFFYGTMFAGVGATVLLVTNHFTAGLLFGAGTENIMKVLFDFMGAGFASGLQSMAGLPGLEFLAASDATLAIIGQVLTAVTLLAAAIVVPYTGARLFQTVQEEISSGSYDEPDEEWNTETKTQTPIPQHKLFEDISTKPEKGLYQVKATLDFTGNVDLCCGDLIGFNKGDILTVLAHPNLANWVRARNEAGQTGDIPLTHVERIVEASHKVTQ